MRFPSKVKLRTTALCDLGKGETLLLGFHSVSNSKLPFPLPWHWQRPRSTAGNRGPRRAIPLAQLVLGASSSLLWSSLVPLVALDHTEPLKRPGLGARTKVWGRGGAGGFSSFPGGSARR